MVSRLLRMQKALGSNPSGSIISLIFYSNIVVAVARVEQKYNYWGKIVHNEVLWPNG